MAWNPNVAPALVTRWLPGQAQASDQPLMAVLPVLVTVTSAVNPVSQLLTV